MNLKYSLIKTKATLTLASNVEMRDKHLRDMMTSAVLPYLDHSSPEERNKGWVGLYFNWYVFNHVYRLEIKELDEKHLAFPSRNKRQLVIPELIISCHLDQELSDIKEPFVLEMSVLEDDQFIMWGLLKVEEFKIKEWKQGLLERFLEKNPSIHTTSLYAERTFKAVVFNENKQISARRNKKTKLLPTVTKFLGWGKGENVSTSHGKEQDELAEITSFSKS